MALHRWTAYALAVAFIAAAIQPASAAIAELEIVVPANAGGGYDLTAQAIRRVLTATKLVPQVTVVYEPGRGGVLALDKLNNEWHGDEVVVMMTGFVMLGTVATARANKLLDPATPVALLTAEPELIVVPAASRYNTLFEIMAAVRATPGAVAFAGGSAGGVDHILLGLLGAQIGVQPNLMPYLPHPGGGDALQTLLSGRASAAIGGVSEFLEPLRSGRIRALAVSSTVRVATVNAPTLTEAGIKLSLLNWRGLLAPPAVGRAHQRALSQIFAKMVKTPQWQAELKKYGWTNQFLPDERFGDYFKAEQKKVETAIQALRLAP